MRVGVLGAGESGVGAALLAKHLKYEVFVSDSGQVSDRCRTELKEYEVPFEEGEHTFERLAQADVIVKSPGIPQHAGIVTQLRGAGKAIISEIEFAFRYCPGKVIAITGSNGKTTTTMLIHHLLTSAGVDAALCGNVGKSFARVVAGDPHDWYVVEVSSYQLEDMDTFQPDIAILLNITPDHLDRYGGDIQAYARTKWRIAERMNERQLFIYHRNAAAEFGLLQEVPVVAERLSVSPEQIISAAGVPDHLRGLHDLFNLLCATEAVKRVGLTAEQIAAGVQSFRKPPHRMQLVATVSGVQYVNDSKATNTDSVLYALLSVAGPVIWIAGGEDKGNDYSTLYDAVRGRVKVLICLGIDNRKLIEAFSSEVDEIMETTSMFEAVRVAASNALPGDTVLLSPACASFDLFVNYIDRGEQFIRAVHQLKEERET